MTALKLNYRIIPKTEVDTIMAHYQDWGDLLLHGTPAKIHTVGLYQTQEADRMQRELLHQATAFPGK